jgi:hypothetical protein
MGVDAVGDAGAPGGLATGVPDDPVGHRLIEATHLQTGEQPAGLVLQRAIVGPQLIEQFGAEGDLAVLAALTLTDVDDHAFLVDVFGPQTAGACRWNRVP